MTGTAFGSCRTLPMPAFDLTRTSVEPQSDADAATISAAGRPP